LTAFSNLKFSCILHLPECRRKKLAYTVSTSSSVWRVRLVITSFLCTAYIFKQYSQGMFWLYDKVLNFRLWSESNSEKLKQKDGMVVSERKGITWIFNCESRRPLRHWKCRQIFPPKFSIHNQGIHLSQRRNLQL
jgi:hypothetical protein